MSRFLGLLRRRQPESSKWFETKLFCSLPRTFEIQINNLLKEGFPCGIDEDRYYSIPYAHVLALEKGKVIGVAKLFKRSIVFNGETIVVGGIGSVTTKQNRRRKGVATAVLRRSMEDFRMRKFDMAFLCANVHNSALIRLYGQVGFVPLGKPYTYRGRSCTEHVDHNGMVAPVIAMDMFKDVVSAEEHLNIGKGSW
jgi:predicted GNAT family N-acyltransferase